MGDKMELTNKNWIAGTPGWAYAALAGSVLIVYFRIHQDTEANVFWAQGVDLTGLFAEGDTVEELFKNVHCAAKALILAEIRDTVTGTTSPSAMGNPKYETYAVSSELEPEPA